MKISNYWSSNCKGYPLKEKCTPSANRRVTRWEHQDVLEKMQACLEQNPDAMRIRRCTLEHPYGTIKAWMGATHFLRDWRGYLMVDDYAGYKALFAAGPTELACMAHIRRKFFDVHAASGSPSAEEALRRIAQLYAVEQQASSSATADPRALREQYALPALAAMHA